MRFSTLSFLVAVVSAALSFAAPIGLLSNATSVAHTAGDIANSASNATSGIAGNKADVESNSDNELHSDAASLTNVIVGIISEAANLTGDTAVTSILSDISDIVSDIVSDIDSDSDCDSDSDSDNDSDSDSVSDSASDSASDSVNDSDCDATNLTNNAASHSAGSLEAHTHTVTSAQNTTSIITKNSTVHVAG